MRLKAVADTVLASAGKLSPVLIAGASVAALGAAYYVVKTTRDAQASSEAANTATTPQSYLTPVMSNAPVSLGGIGSSGASGADTIATVLGAGGTSASASGDSAGASSGAVQAFTSPDTGPAPYTPTDSSYYGGFGKGIDPATQALIDLEYLKEDHTYSFNMAQLASNYEIQAMNAYNNSQYIQGMNYQAATGLAQSFLMSGKSLSTGVITDANGSPILNFAMMQEIASKKDKTNISLSNALARGDVSNFWNQIPGNANIGGATMTTPGMGSVVTPAPTGASVYNPFGGGSSAAQTLLAGYGSKSTTPQTIPSIPQSTQQQTISAVTSSQQTATPQTTTPAPYAYQQSNQATVTSMVPQPTQAPAPANYNTADIAATVAANLDWSAIAGAIHW